MNSSTIALATLLAVVGGPAKAGTWVTVYETGPWQSSDNKSRDYQIDTQSISKHQGWAYANQRICLDGYDCRRPFSIGAQCRKQKYMSRTVVYTHRFGSEWWTNYDIQSGSRVASFESAERKARSLKVQRGLDRRYTAAFNFLCGKEL